ncbi:MAG: tryptophan synthase subunit alpha [Chloroflexota bacterium]
MNRIDRLFGTRHRKALIAYVTVGYPSVETTLRVVPSLVEGGCDMIELGVPFSDPLADGATIQRASHAALQQGITLDTCLEVAATLRRTVDVPLLFMSYFNPILAYGLQQFCAASTKAGIDGLIVPDLPPEEGAGLEELAERYHLHLVYLVTPTSSEKRVRLIASRSRGFIYAVSLRGTTGARDTLPAELETFLDAIRSIAAQPLCVGFGIATPAQAARAAEKADGVIIGSRIMEIIESSDQPASAAREFIEQIRDAISPD